MDTPVYTDHFVDTNNIKLHYIDYGGNHTPLLLLHGLTANAHAFDGLVHAGLTEHFRVISPDLRGRGLSSEPAFCYTMLDHAKDILGLIDSLGFDKVVLGGHSFGGYLSMYLAANYPERVERLIIIDTALSMNPNVGEMLMPSLSRIGQKWPSFDAYIDTIKKAGYVHWDDTMLSYYRADVMDLPDGSVTTYSNLTNIAEMSAGIAQVDWEHVVETIKQPVILLNGVDDYTLDQPLLPDTRAKETVEMMQDAKYIAVDGNHHTMLYYNGAKQVVCGINNFVPETTA